MSARYHLRFQIHPYEGPDAVAAAAAELAKSCTDSGVAEVVLLLGAEEHFTGHLAGSGRTSGSMPRPPRGRCSWTRAWT